MSATNLVVPREHPFKEGVRQLLRQHFDESIVKRFSFALEVERFDTPNTRNQLKDQRYILEVYYNQPSGLIEFICDLQSWISKEQTEYELLRHITDKVKAGTIGKDWVDKKDKISADIKSGKHETKEVS